MARSNAASGVAKRSPRNGQAQPGPLTPIARETVHDRVYRELRKALVYGAFEPGHVLTIQELATSLATSTMPVRDALARLISEQALEELPNRSARIPLVEAGRLRDLLHARQVIEGAALELAMPRLTKQDFEALRTSIRDYDKALGRRGRASLEAELEANRAFHFRLYEASGSAVLIPIIESLWLQSGPVVRAAVKAFDPASAISAPHYHAEIVSALERGDIASAKAALSQDIGRAFALAEAASVQPAQAADGESSP